MYCGLRLSVIHMPASQKIPGGGSCFRPVPLGLISYCDWLFNH